MNNKNVLFITRTAVLLALTLVLQYLTRVWTGGSGIGSILIVGSVVNACIVLSAYAVGIWGGAIISVLTPITAFFQGHLANPLLIPIVAIGNFVLVLGVCLMIAVVNKSRFTALVPYASYIGVVAGSIVKFIVMYLSALLIVPIMGFAPAMVKAVQLNFSWPQLVTALIGGVVGILLTYPLIRARAIDKREIDKKAE